MLNFFEDSSAGLRLPVEDVLVGFGRLAAFVMGVGNMVVSDGHVFETI
jgi:hypothetical protein